MASEIAWQDGQCPMSIKVGNVRVGCKAHAETKNITSLLIAMVGKFKVLDKNEHWGTLCGSSESFFG
jgi:hypothetical protein